MLLNTGKSEVWNPFGLVPDELRHFKALAPEGFELLGAPIGTTAFCQTFFAKKVQNFREVWAKIQKLDHSCRLKRSFYDTVLRSAKWSTCSVRSRLT